VDKHQLAALARQALGQYDLTVTRLRLASLSTNAIYRVTAQGGVVHALRLATSGWRTLTDLRAEALWLEALARDTQIGAPRVVRARNGDAVLTLDGGTHVTLMDWLPGRLLGKMGALFAALHAHAANWQPPAGFSQRRFERFLSRGEPDVLASADMQALYPTGAGNLVQRVRARVDAAYAALDRADLRVIHCDLWHDNIKVHRGRLLPFDFEDTIWGYRLHDIAMAMLDLHETAGLERYEHMLAEFRAGYCGHLAWPEGDLDALQMGRMLWKLNYIARVHREGLASYMPFFVALCERFLTTGRALPPFRP
jgi:Ser/Thr protein kinase RdoA (MazF antagonist)